jgi:hypothetical protein
MLRMAALGVVLAMIALPARAEFSKIEDRETFVGIVRDRTLSRPMVSLEVSPAGQISGRGAVWDVTGEWNWQNGYFCRDLVWGGDSLGYDCQRVEVRRDGRIRFISDRGRGQMAEFTLR